MLTSWSRGGSAHVYAEDIGSDSFSLETDANIWAGVSAGIGGGGGLPTAPLRMYGICNLQRGRLRATSGSVMNAKAQPFFRKQGKLGLEAAVELASSVNKTIVIVIYYIMIMVYLFKR